MMDVHPPLDTKPANKTTNTNKPSSSPSDAPPAHMAPPPSLSSMSIRSTDTLTNQEIDSRVPEAWNEQPPLLQQTQRKGVTEETTALLKGVRLSFVHDRWCRFPMGVFNSRQCLILS
jgi:hypothetical protein